MKRLFFALWPDQMLRNRCATLQRSLPKLESCRPVDPGNFHVTLVFLGGIEPELESALVHAAGGIEFESVEIVFDRISFWRKPGIVCLTSSDPDLKATALADHLSSIAASFGHPVDERPFKPHVTLVKKVRQDVRAEIEPIVWRADAFCLVESCSVTGGVEYRVIRRWPSVADDTSQAASSG